MRRVFFTLLVLMWSSFLFGSENPYVIPFGKYKGQEIDRTRFRPINTLINPEIEPFKKHLSLAEMENHTYVRNFKHGEVWYDAAIPNNVKQVNVVIVNFPAIVPAAHALLHFELETPAVLIHPEGKGNIIKTRHIVMSAEAARPAGVAFNLIEGWGKNSAYPIVSIFGTFVDYAQAIESWDHQANIKHYALENLGPEQRNRVLQAAASKSIMDGYWNHRYNTVSKSNCCGVAIDTLDAALPPLQLGWSCESVKNGIGEIYPSVMHWALEARNIFSLRSSRVTHVFDLPYIRPHLQTQTKLHRNTARD